MLAPYHNGYGGLMVAPSGTLAFHFDFISPYAYLAWTQVHDLVGRCEWAVDPVPTLLAALLAHGQTKGPAEIPAKRVYMVADVLRVARKLGVPLAPPASHPFNPLLALRVATVEPQWKVIEALFTATWATSQPIDTEEGVARVLDKAGLPGAELVTRAQHPDTKWLLRKRTDEAIARGVFGVPTMFARDQMFWGVDSLEYLADYLGGGGVDVAAEMKKWVNVKPTATRAEG
jgi:2-hydroxychromene-2-carboxylate isomerase